MKHYGDITKIHGNRVEPVDIITGGSPCQDLSVAGKRAGLDGERSGLFMDQVRIVKEMRDNDVRSFGSTGRFVRPRYMVWENVPGAFSSNGGKDFQAVLTEIARVAEPECPDVPMPEKNKWRKAGCVYGDMGQWSIAWRVHDAQFWGVPQRRKRIALVADFGGMSAPEILFERKGLSWNTESCGEEGQGTPRNAENSAGTAISFQERAEKPGGGKGLLIQGEHTGALSTLNNQSVCCGCDVYNQDITGDTAASVTAAAGGSNTSGPKVMVLNDQKVCCSSGDIAGTLDASYYKGAGERNGVERDVVCYGIGAYNSEGMKSENPSNGIRELDAARTLDNSGVNPACYQGGVCVVETHATVMDAYQHHGYRESDTCGTLTEGQNQSVRDDTSFVVYDASRRHDYKEMGDTCETVQASYGTGGNNTPIVLEWNGARESHKGSGFAKSETMYTLNTIERHAVCAGFKAGQSMKGGIGWAEEQAATLSADCSGTEPSIVDGRTEQNTVGSLCASGYSKNGTQEAQNGLYIVQKMYDGSDIAPTLTSKNAGGNQRMPDKDNFNAVVSYGLDRATYNQGQNAKFDFSIEKEKIGTQVAKGPGAVCTAVDVRNNTEDENINGALQADANKNLNSNNVVRKNSMVRRLTPLECERLQGYPDGWTDIGEWVDSKGKKHKDADSPRYKALGNSIALPFWAWLARRICAYYERPMTMASLFDGIGGFPLVFSRAGCRPVWASEIEEFPIAVTKIRFPERSNDEPHS